MGTYLLSSNQYYDDFNEIFVPRVEEISECMQEEGMVAEYWVDGGCPSLERFSMVKEIGVNTEVANIWKRASDEEVAGIFQWDPDGNGDVLSPQGYNNGTLFMPFSYIHLVDIAGLNDGLVQRLLGTYQKIPKQRVCRRCAQTHDLPEKQPSKT